MGVKAAPTTVDGPAGIPVSATVDVAVDPARARAVLLGVALVSASALAYELTLTRLFALLHGHQFAFIAVGVAMLGLGAAGSTIAVSPRVRCGGPATWATVAGCQAGATLAVYLVMGEVPLDVRAVGADPDQWWYLAAVYTAAAVPFYLAGMVVGGALAVSSPGPLSPGRVYGIGLIGSAGGTMAAVALVGVSGPAGTVGLAIGLALCGAAILTVALERRPRALVGAALLVALLVASAAFGLLDYRPGPSDELAALLEVPGAAPVSSDWAGAGRVDIVRGSGVRSFPGLSVTHSGALPDQDALLVDGRGAGPLVHIDPWRPGFARAMSTGLPYLLRSGADALVLEPRGGLDVIVALGMDAAAVTAVEPLSAAIGSHTGTVYDHPSVTTVDARAREYVASSVAHFDVVALALTSHQPVGSGASDLLEDHRYTVEAFTAYLDRLEPAGLFAVAGSVDARSLGEARLVATAAAALRRSGRDQSGAIAVVRGFSTVLVVVAPDGYSSRDLDVMRGFAAAHSFEVVPIPAASTGVLAGSSGGSGGAAVVDDRPFPYRLASAEGSSSATSRAFGGAERRITANVGLVSVVAVTLLIFAPLRFGAPLRRVRGRDGSWVIVYFGVIAAGFMFIEIPLLSRYLLLFDGPVAFGVVVATLLTATGAGSVVAHRIRWRAGAIGAVAAGAVSAASVVPASDVLLAWPLPGRVAAGVVLLVPFGFLAGTMMPHGLAAIRQRAGGSVVPWAWGVNAAVSVVAATGAALSGAAWGLTVTMTLGVGCYAAAAVLVRPGWDSEIDPSLEAPATATPASDEVRLTV